MSLALFQACRSPQPAGHLAPLCLPLSWHHSARSPGGKHAQVSLCLARRARLAQASGLPSRPAVADRLLAEGPTSSPRSTETAHARSVGFCHAGPVSLLHPGLPRLQLPPWTSPHLVLPPCTLCGSALVRHVPQPQVPGLLSSVLLGRSLCSVLAAWSPAVAKAHARPVIFRGRSGPSVYNPFGSLPSGH